MRKRNIAKAIAILTAVSMVTAVPMASFTTETGSDEPVESVVATGNDKITIKGDVDNHNGKAVEVNAEKGGDASVTVEGKITSTTDDVEEPYTNNNVNTVTVNANGGKASATVKDILTETDLNSDDFKKKKSGYTANGIYESSSNSGSASVTVNGNIDVTASSTATDPDCKSTLASAHGIYIKANSNATSTAVINGNIHADADTSSIGVSISAGDNDSTKSTGTVDVTVNGDISAESNGIHSNDLGTNNITVNGDIDAKTGMNITGEGDFKNSVSGAASVTVNGNIAGKNTGILIQTISNKADVTVDGNVKSNSYGIVVRDNYGDISIVTDGTVSGDKTAIYIANTVNVPEREIVEDTDNKGSFNEKYTGETINSKTDVPNIIVWKLESSSSKLITAETETYHYKKDNNGKLILDDEGQPIVDDDYEDESTTTENKTLADKVAKAINYIIKGSVSENGKDTNNGKLVLTGTSGTVTVGDKTYQTAHQDETITINVETISGYKYSLKNGEALLKANTDGTYTLKVPAGGVDLRAVLEKIQESNSNNNNSSNSSGNSDNKDNNSSGNKNNSNSSNKTNGSSSGNRSSSSGGSGSGSSGLSTGSYIVVGSNGVSISQLTSIISTPGAWSKDAGNNWIYVNASGSSYKNDWIAAGNRWYYLNDKGNPMTGWQLINGVWYYFAATDSTANPLGSMYVSATTPDGYKVDANGAYVK